MTETEPNSGAHALPYQEHIVGSLIGGEGFLLEEAEAFCKILHADAAIQYHAGIIYVRAVRAQAVS